MQNLQNLEKTLDYFEKFAQNWEWDDQILDEAEYNLGGFVNEFSLENFQELKKNFIIFEENLQVLEKTYKLDNKQSKENNSKKDLTTNKQIKELKESIEIQEKGLEKIKLEIDKLQPID